MDASTGETQRRQWEIALRSQEYEGEGRANLLRIVALDAFYTIHPLNYHPLLLDQLSAGKPNARAQRFHQVETSLAIVWTMLALGLLVCLLGSAKWLSLQRSDTNSMELY